MVKQTISAVRAGIDNPNVQREVINKTLEYLQKADLNLSPPEIGKYIYKIIAETSGITDIYDQEKLNFNQFVLENYGLLRKIVYLSDDPVYLAAKLSIAGNQFRFESGNADVQLRTMLSGIHSITFAIDDYSQFLDDVLKTKNILYLADNAGEIVFDKLFIEVLKKFYPERGHHFTVVVRGAPIINDATMKDAEMIDLDEVASVVDNGDNAPATLLHHVSDQMRAIYDSADLVISKGQGNFESLNEEDKKIYFMFRIKCPVISRELNAPEGGLVLMHSETLKRNINCEHNYLNLK
jgi:damage-control phosphatase, subfamily I